MRALKPLPLVILALALVIAVVLALLLGPCFLTTRPSAPRATEPGVAGGPVP